MLVIWIWKYELSLANRMRARVKHMSLNILFVIFLKLYYQYAKFNFGITYDKHIDIHLNYRK